METMKKIDLFRCRICGEILDKYEVHTEYFKFLEKNDKIGDLGRFICTNCIIKESGIKKLYHLSRDCNVIDKFIPRIPEHRAKDEEALTSRVSLAPTIEGCLTAVPWGGKNLEDLFWEDGSFLVRVYEFDIDDLNLNNLLPPEYLFSKDLVIDSRITKEYWYTKPIKPSRSYLIEIDNYDEYVCDYVRYDDIIAGIYAEMDEDNYFNWENVIDGSFVEIQNVKYHVVPEERRSKFFTLNHKIEGILNKNFNNIIDSIMDEFSATRTWVEIEERNDGNYIVGELDARGYFELDKERIIEFLNEKIILLNGKIIE